MIFFFMEFRSAGNMVKIAADVVAVIDQVNDLNMVSVVCNL